MIAAIGPITAPAIQALLWDPLLVVDVVGDAAVLVFEPAEVFVELATELDAPDLANVCKEGEEASIPVPVSSVSLKQLLSTNLNQ